MKAFFAGLCLVMPVVHATAFAYDISCIENHRDPQDRYSLTVTTQGMNAAIQHGAEELPPFEANFFLDSHTRRGEFIVLHSSQRPPAFMYFDSKEDTLNHGNYMAWFSAVFDDSTAPEAMKFIPGAVQGEGKRWFNAWLGCTVK